MYVNVTYKIELKLFYSPLIIAVGKLNIIWKQQKLNE